MNLAINEDLNRNLLGYDITIGAIDITPIGVVQHVMIFDSGGKQPQWADMQLIKNTLYGNESYAVQVFPPESKLTDVVDAYHLWVKVDDLANVPIGWDKARSVLPDGRQANTRI